MGYPTCACGGSKDGPVGYLRRVFRISPYQYRVFGQPVKTTTRMSTNETRPLYRVHSDRESNRERMRDYLDQHKTVTTDAEEKPAHWHLYRHSYDESRGDTDEKRWSDEIMCYCGRWIDLHAEKSARFFRDFHDARAAEEWARRLQYGIPQNWEIVVGGIVVATQIAVGVIF